MNSSSSKMDITKDIIACGINKGRKEMPILGSDGKGPLLFMIYRVDFMLHCAHDSCGCLKD